MRRLTLLELVTFTGLTKVDMEVVEGKEGKWVIQGKSEKDSFIVWMAKEKDGKRLFPSACSAHNTLYRVFSEHNEQLPNYYVRPYKKEVRPRKKT